MWRKKEENFKLGSKRLGEALKHNLRREERKKKIGQREITMEREENKHDQKESKNRKEGQHRCAALWLCNIWHRNRKTERNSEQADESGTGKRHFGCKLLSEWHKFGGRKRNCRSNYLLFLTCVGVHHSVENCIYIHDIRKLNALCAMYIRQYSNIKVKMNRQ